MLATTVTAWGVARSPILVHPGGLWIWRSLFVASYLAVGGYTWWRRPESRIGPIVAAYGFLYSLTTLNASGDPLAHTLGMVLWAAYIVYTGYVFLCFPRGRLASRLQRRFMLAWVLSAVLLLGLICALSPALPAGSDFTNCGTACPHNALQVVTGYAATGMALISAFNIVFTVAAIGVAMLVFEQARSSSRLRRRALTPLAAVVLANIVEFVVSLFLPSAFPETRETLKVLNGLTTLAVPAAIFAGQLRGAAFAAVSLGQIALREGGRSMTAADVQRVIAEALGDPTLRLAVWASERGVYVDLDGRALELPGDGPVPGVTRISRNDGPLAVLIHNPTLDTDSDIVEGLAATSLLLLENTRLVEELRASRLRIVQTAARERQRLEQDLHDGAQQRLTAVQIRLRLAQAKAESEELSAELEAIGLEAAEAIEELRTLAHGIYPLSLQDRGLPGALRALARRSDPHQREGRWHQSMRARCRGSDLLLLTRGDSRCNQACRLRRARHRGNRTRPRRRALLDRR